MKREFDTIEDCLAALARGEIVVVTDDEDRENEGDCICAARFATTANVNFMATYADGKLTAYIGTENNPQEGSIRVTTAGGSATYEVVYGNH